MTNVPGGMWLEDLRNGGLTVTHHVRHGSRHAPVGKKSRNWVVGWAQLRRHHPRRHKSYSKKKRRGTNYYRVSARYGWLASAPLAMRSGSDLARWKVGDHKTGEGAATQPGATGAGESRVLTHDAVTMAELSSFPMVSGCSPPDGSRHGLRDYLLI